MQIQNSSSLFKKDTGFQEVSLPLNFEIEFAFELQLFLPSSTSILIFSLILPHERYNSRRWIRYQTLPPDNLNQ